MIKLRGLIEEAVVYSKFKGIKKGMEKRHGSKMVGGTFGVEFEFKPGGGNLDYDYIMDELFNNKDVKIEFEKELDLKRRQLNHEYIRWHENLNDINYIKPNNPPEWLNELGPIDVELWNETHPMVKNGYNNDELLKYKWFKDRTDIGIAYNSWENSLEYSDLYQEFINRIIDSDSWSNYIDYKGEVEADVDIEEAILFLHNNGENVKRGDDSESDVWAVGMDINNVEIRSKHMTIRDIPILKKVLGWLRGKETNDNTSAHVHIGLPEGFNAFNLICLWDLVDEKQVKLDIGAGRNLNWAKLQDDLRGRLYDNINKGKKEGRDVYSIVMSKSGSGFVKINVIKTDKKGV